jgi:hypothetical protein
MEEFIISETSKVFTKGIKKYVEKYGCEKHDLSILLYMKESEKEGYQIYVGGEYKEDVTIKDILGVKFMDLKGISAIAPPYIQKILNDCAVELNSQKVDINVYLNEDESDVRYFLYENGKFQKEVFLNDLLAKSVL